MNEKTKKSEERDASPQSDETTRNNPGRTPGQAEGEERDVEAALRNEEKKEPRRS